MTPHSDILQRLEEFAEGYGVREKGTLCVALVMTRAAKEQGLPLAPDEQMTRGRGQVKGLGKSQVQAILRDYGITRTLAEEGGRTSRGSLGNMRAYVSFLNQLHDEGLANLGFIESWWADRVRDYFAAQPFTLRLDPSKSLRAVVRELLDQAQKRQAESSGTMFVGAVLQHLVGAKLDILLEGKVAHHGASVADEVSGREADFLVEDTAVHVTAAPNEAVVRKCERNLAAAKRPIIVTLARGVAVAQGLADQKGIGERIDVFDAEQFIAGNIHERGKFARRGREDIAHQLIEKYNAIVSAHETDPSLQIEIAG